MGAIREGFMEEVAFKPGKGGCMGVLQGGKGTPSFCLVVCLGKSEVPGVCDVGSCVHDPTQTKPSLGSSDRRGSLKDFP